MARISTKAAGDDKALATMASSVFEKLRSDILEGVIAPGEKLRIDALRDRYNVGASPLREALNRLSALHLVEQTDQRGFRVAPVSRESVRELARTRCWVSEVAVREAIRTGDTAWEEEVVLAYHRLWRHHQGMPPGQPDREWERLHRRFHAALIAACPSHWLRDFHESLFDLADRERHLSVANHSTVRDPMSEHREIMEAVVQRDEARAIDLLNRHFWRTATMAEASFSPAADLVEA